MARNLDGWRKMWQNYPMDEAEKAALRKMAEEILSGGEQAVEQADLTSYTVEELEFLEQEIDASVTRDLNAFMQELDASEKE